MQLSILPQAASLFTTRVAPRSLSAACALLLATVALGHAESAPIFDLRVTDGKIIDASATARLVETPDAIVTPEGSISITANPAIVIPYREDDPLFQSGAFTWIIKAKLKNPTALPEGKNYGLFWRWDAKSNARSVCLQLNEGREFFFALTTDGTTKSLTGVKVQASEIPPDEWITFVCRFEPNTQLIMEICDQNNAILKEAVIRQNIPAALFSEHDAPFVIGTPEELGYSIARIQVWNEFIPDEKLPDLLKK